MKNKLVSVIIPTYRTNNSLEKAIESALRQTYENIEIIVVDNNEPNTPERTLAQKIIKKYSRHKNVRYMLSDKIKNGSAARNLGASCATGHYVAFLDDDDYYYEDKIRKQIDKMLQTGAMFCVCYYKKNGRTYKFQSRKDYTKNILVRKKVPQTSSFIMEKKLFDAVGGFDDTFSRHQDLEFLIRICQMAKVATIRQPLYERTHNGVDNRVNAKELEKIKHKYINKYKYLYKKYNLSTEVINSIQYSQVIITYLKQGDKKNAMRLFMEQNRLLVTLEIIRELLYLTWAKINA